MSAIARARVLGVAESQLGLVSRAQLVRSGLSGDQIKRQIADGSLIVVHRSVYRVAGAPADSVEHRALAACMACGDASVASHRTAALLRRLIDADAQSIDVTVPPRKHPKRDGIRIYRSSVTDVERTSIGLVPVTTVERTLLDLSSSLGESDLEDAADRAFRGRWTTPSQLDAYLGKRLERARAGVWTLRRIVDDRVGRGIPESVLEAKMIALLRRFRLPDPVRQHVATVGGRAVRFDLAYPDASVAIELDGRAPHWGRDRWQADHHRDNAIELGGWKKLSFTWWDVVHDEAYVVATVAQKLGLRPKGWRRA
jgi:very-short-patch-repair endonuclease